MVYLEALRVDFVTPAIGSLDGGDVVEVIGSGFMPGLTCQFGASEATAILVLSPTRFQCTIPQQASFGFVDVTVRSVDQTNEGKRAKAFLYSQFFENDFIENFYEFNSLDEIGESVFYVESETLR